MGVRVGSILRGVFRWAAACEGLYVLFQFSQQQWRMGAGLTGTFDNPAGLALCLGLSLPFVRYLSESLNGSSTSRICVRALECLLVLGVLLSRSRTGCCAFCSIPSLCFVCRRRFVPG